MLILNAREFFDNPPALLAYLLAMVVVLFTAFAFHEFSHAWAAYELGDDTAARQGRLTLNPLVHVDPLGTALIFLIGFGWAKPTPFNPYRLKNGPRWGSIIVAGAGPLSNFVFAAVAALPIRLGLIDSFTSFENVADASGEEIIGLFLAIIIVTNVILGVFNLLPIHPLDGFKVAVGALPRDLSRPLEQLAPYGPGILMTLLVAGFILPPELNPLSIIFDQVGGRILDVIL
ncbi:MAG: site-2 protease family protein [Dehalococcoidia bacterium]|nr:site-2 protease family protein [Dehalococcoidia bacterium]